MTVILDSLQSFEAIQTWADRARELIQADANNYSVPSLDEIKNHLVGGVFSKAELGERDGKGRTLICLSVDGPRKSDASVDRFMLPAHAALSRMLELLGAKIGLIRGSGGSINKYYFDMALNKKLRTNLHRALFGVASSGRLWERKLDDGYRYIVPSQYMAGPGVTRGGIIAAIEAKLERQNKRVFS
jgi:hypothetical protein